MEQDAEIAAMDTIARALAPLEEHARTRVIAWAAGRFGAALLPKGASPVGSQLSPALDSPRTEFETFAELFDATDPQTEKDKVLVAAYWAQVCQGQPMFPSQTLNSSLKDLGHGVSNITSCLDTLKDEKPALALQLKKSGTSKQARKTYKLTQEGAKRVRQMIENRRAE
jgi:hypothetical protein